MNKIFIPATLVVASLFATANTASAQQPVAQVLEILVNSVEFEEGQLVALATVTLDIAGNIVTQDIEIPLSLDGTAGPEGECDILNLSVGPVALDLLGLNVELDDCDDGPVTVDIVAVEGALLGDLLCAVAGLLDGGLLSLEEILGGLDDADLALLTGALTEILNEIFGELLDTGEVAASDNGGAQENGLGAQGKGKAKGHSKGKAQGQARGHRAQGSGRCDILTLEIPESITLNVLGLEVITSPICLDVYAQSGGGNLLGNLLCSLTNLLDGNASSNAIDRLLTNIGRLLGRLGLLGL